MQLQITKVNPAGNTTLLVDGSVPSVRYASLAVQLMEKYDAEQVAYIVPPNDADIAIEMMGGEFCGNALRSAGYFYAVQHNVSSVRVRISGCDTVMTVTCVLAEGKASAEMPLPSAFSSIDNMPVAVFDGIAHALCRDKALDETYARRITREMCQKFGVSAAGIMFLDHGFLRPAVYVCGTDTLFLENSCASGSAAVAALLSSDRPDGVYSYILEQPGGSITARAEVSEGKISALSIGGSLSLDETFTAVI